MPRYDKKCWFCGKKSMESKGEYYQCSECLATWNDPPKLGASYFTESDWETGGSPTTYGDTYLRPSPKALRKAAKQRELAQGGKL